MGDYSVSNYGDQLYPEVVEHLLRQRGFDGDVVLFAPNPGVSPTGTPIQPIRDVPGSGVGAVLVGGGDLIRTDSLVVAHDHLNIATADRGGIGARARGHLYRRRRLLAGPGPWLPAGGWSHEGPTVFVSVGVHKLEGRRLRSALESVDRAWVRTEGGAKNLVRAGYQEDRVEVAPDAIFAAPHLANLEPLVQAGSEVLRAATGGDEPVVVFHAAYFQGWSARRIRDTLARLAQHTVVTLALGAYAGEDRALAAAASNAGIPSLVGLSTQEITGVLAAAGCLISTSMHAAIVASSAGTPVIVPGVAKTASALAVCPDPPTTFSASGDDMTNVVSDVLGSRVRVPSTANADAVRDVFNDVLDRVGM